MKKPIAILLIAAIITLAVATCVLPLAACATTNNQETSLAAAAMPALAQGSKGTPSESDSSSMEFTTNARGYEVTKNEEDVDLLQMVAFSSALLHDDTTRPYNSSDNIQNGGDLHTLEKISSGSKPPVKVSKSPVKVSEPPVKVSKQSPVHNINTGEDFETIQAAIDDSDTLNGHTITVDAGTYTENVAVNKRLTIRSENGADVTVVQAATHGYVIEVTASFVTISGFTVTEATGACGGIWLRQVDNCNICDNKVLHNEIEGIRVSSSCNNTLSGNDCFYNGDGIVLCLSNSNTLSGNDCSDNYYGIVISSSNDNELKSNIVNSNHFESIHMANSYNNVITKTTASNNNWAIWMDDTSICSNNLIYLNNFINNANNIFISSGSTNIWNSPLEITYIYDGTAYTNYLGNYWDDYTGSDTNNDGIGDIPYTLNSENDNYPLMNGFENYNVKPLTPSITSHAPESPVDDYVGTTRTFNITTDQTVNVSWQINGTEVQTNASVTAASYTNTSAVNGTWNVSAIVSNANGTDLQTWDWTVTLPCFIATAAYGTALHDDIDVLREFRDDYLMPNPAGRAFVKIYYAVSPPLANAIRDNEGLRTAVRNGIVKPVVYVSRRFVR